ncbi:MAG: GNAT family N-acetyltransferase [Actinomycetota bacterium]
MTDGFVMRPLDIETDAEKLAEMFNSSDDVWPGTFTHGVPFTASRAREWVEKQTAREEQVWVDGDFMAGYCSLWDWPDEENVTYIALLNVQPKFHKHGYGRKFLTYYVDKVKDLGSARLDLHTWSGNLKAMPLYKKTGFFWMPDTQVHMLNFMPAILRMDLAKPFFAKHDWYTTYKRDLSQVEDDERWEGMKVFTYRFEADGESLTVWADREARTLTAIETDDFFVAAVAPEISVAGGLPADIEWRLKNKTDKPVDVSLIASGTEHLKLEQRSNFSLAPNEESTIAAKVKVSVDAPEVKGNKPVPAVKSVFIIDGKPIELGTGLRPRRAIEVSTYPTHPLLIPGVSQRVEIGLRSRFKKNIAATATLVAPEGLAIDRSEVTVDVSAEGRAGFEIDVTTAKPGLYEVPLSINFDIDGEQIVLPPKPIGVLSLTPGGICAGIVDETLMFANSSFLITIPKTGAWTSFRDVDTQELISQMGGYPVPPFDPSEYWDAEYELAIERSDDGVLLIARCRSKQNPGFVFKRTLTVGGGPIIKVTNGFENQSSKAMTFQSSQWFSTNRNGDHVLPLATGLRTGWTADFPGSVDDDFKKPETYSERWATLEHERGVFGVIWGSDVEEVTSAGFNHVTRSYDCPPASTVTLEPTYVYCGPGDHTHVESLYRRAQGERIDPNEPLSDPGPSIEAAWDPEVALLGGEESTVVLTFTNPIPRMFDGNAELELPDGWAASLSSFELKNINYQHAFRQDILLKTTSPPHAAKAKLKVRGAEHDARFDLPLIRLSGPGSVTTERDGDDVIISNGTLDIDVRATFGGTVTSIRRDGVEQLLSSYPQAQAFGWISPWYGGITALLMTGKIPFPGKLWEESWEAEPTSSSADGLGWKGATLSSVLKNEEAAGLSVSIDVLTLPSSPVIRYCMTVQNLTSAGREVTFGPGLFAQPGSSRDTVLRSAERTTKPNDRYLFGRVGDWAAVEENSKGDVIGMVSSQPVGFMHWGTEGGHMMQFVTFHLPPSGSKTVSNHIVLAPSMDSFEGFQALSKLP